MDIFENDDGKKELLEIFQNEYETIYERISENLLKLEKNSSDKELVLNLYRDFHGIKGAVRMVGYSNIQQIYHKVEDIFDYIKKERPQEKLRAQGVLVGGLETHF